MSIFRQRALERITSPEQLDTALVAAAPRHWIAFAAAAAVVAAAVAWGVFGSVATRIGAEGILLSHDSEIFSAAAEGDGQLVEILVALGSSVAKGQAVALLKQDVDQARLARAEGDLARAQARLAELTAHRDGDLARWAALDERRLTAVEEKLENGRYRAEVLASRLAAMRGLLERGYTDKTSVLDIEDALAKVRESLSELRYEGLTIEAERNRLEEDWRQQIVAQQKDVEAAEDKIDDLRQLLKLSRTVDAPISGTVTELSASLGDVVSAGTPVVRIASRGEDTDALLFVSPREGKRIGRGYAVNVEPSVIKKEEVGTALAVVAAVSDLPMSTAAIQAMLHNEKLVEAFSREGAPIVVRADLVHDPDSPSRFAWTGGRGPDFAIESGTLVKATITVREQAPVTLILPFLKSVLGL